MFKNKSLTATSLGFRIVIGGYLIYLAYKLIPSFQAATKMQNMILFGSAIVLFLGVGAVLTFFSVKALIKGEYDKGTTTEVNEMEKEDNNSIEESNDNTVNDDTDKDDK